MKFNLGDKVCFKSEFNLRDPKPRSYEVVGVYHTANGWSYKLTYGSTFHDEKNLVAEADIKSFFIDMLTNKVKEVLQWS